MRIQKSIDIDNIRIIKNKYNLPDDIIEYIKLYLFDYNLFKNIWQNRMYEILSNIDKGYKLIPIYKIPINNLTIFNLNNKSINEMYCVECYLEALIKRKTYVENINCVNCYDIKYIYQLDTSNYKYISYNEFKNRSELKYLNNIYGYKKIKPFINSSKYLTEMVLLGNSEHYQTKLTHLALLCEIKYYKNKKNNII